MIESLIADAHPSSFTPAKVILTNKPMKIGAVAHSRAKLTSDHQESLSF
jgi:hypothetical protein